MKNKKLFILICMTILFIPIMGKAVYAVTYGNYSATVPAVSDYETPHIKKKTSGPAYNIVNSDPWQRLVSWVENNSGTNITNKATYKTSGTKKMDYKNGSAHKDKNVRLNISTDLGVYFKVETSGRWTPN